MRVRVTMAAAEFDVARPQAPRLDPGQGTCRTNHGHWSLPLSEAVMHLYSAPRNLPPRLDRARAHWRSLIRKAAPMPFWDDLTPTDMGNIGDDAFTLEAFDKPERFRFALVGKGLEAGCDRELEGFFLGEGPLPSPFDFLLSQASATVEAGQPTLHRNTGPKRYDRLLLPMRGDGRTCVLLGVVDGTRATPWTRLGLIQGPPPWARLGLLQGGGRKPGTDPVSRLTARKSEKLAAIRSDTPGRPGDPSSDRPTQRWPAPVDEGAR